MEITSDLFQAYLKCSMKCWLRSCGEVSTRNTYANWVKTQDESYRVNETARLVGASANSEVATSLAIENLKSIRWQFAKSVAAQAQTNSCLVESCLQAVERAPSDGRGKPARLIPIRFIFRNKLTKDDKLLLSFDAFVLSEALGREISLGKIVHGGDHVQLRVKTSAFDGEVRKHLGNLAALLSSPTPLDLVLNRHCPECEFRDHCWQTAVQTDDLSLLASMSGKERRKLRSKGIFTVKQLSCTFRPRRRPKRLRGKREKYHHALKALAIREKKIHIVGSPELKIEGTPVYLDVEGLPDRDFYYLIGVRIGNGDSAVQHSL
jgi:predicted RecB family nuclease